MGMVSFSNPGIIDPAVWSTFGVSIKEGDNPIGQFGTGLKYAIAVLMREGRRFSISSGGNVYEFATQSADIRGKEFAQITCNGEALPFTTHLGSKWELWHAYRELYSNCVDEGGELGADGETVISAEIGDTNHASVFLEKENMRAISVTSECEIYAGNSKHLYFKGIRAMDLPTPSRYTYNILEADLTEDRTFKYMFQVYSAISGCVLRANCVDFITDFLLQTRDWFEKVVDFDYGYKSPTDTVINVVKQYRRESCYQHPGLAGKAIKHLGPDIHEPSPMDERQTRIVEKAAAFCGDIGYPITYPVKLVIDMGGDTLAIADRKTQTILLSDRVLTQGVKQVASTLIEENLHLQKGLQDCTYDMQTYLFDQIVTMGERLTGEIL